MLGRCHRRLEISNATCGPPEENGRARRHVTCGQQSGYEAERKLAIAVEALEMIKLNLETREDEWSLDLLLYPEEALKQIEASDD